MFDGFGVLGGQPGLLAGVVEDGVGPVLIQVVALAVQGVDVGVTKDPWLHSGG